MLPEVIPMPTLLLPLLLLLLLLLAKAAAAAVDCRGTCSAKVSTSRDKGGEAGGGNSEFPELFIATARNAMTDVTTEDFFSALFCHSTRQVIASSVCIGSVSTNIEAEVTAADDDADDNADDDDDDDDDDDGAREELNLSKHAVTGSCPLRDMVTTTLPCWSGVKADIVLADNSLRAFAVLPSNQIINSMGPDSIQEEEEEEGDRMNSPHSVVESSLVDTMMASFQTLLGGS